MRARRPHVRRGAERTRAASPSGHANQRQIRSHGRYRLRSAAAAHPGSARLAPAGPMARLQGHLRRPPVEPPLACPGRARSPVRAMPRGQGTRTRTRPPLSAPFAQRLAGIRRLWRTTSMPPSMGHASSRLIIDTCPHPPGTPRSLAGAALRARRPADDRGGGGAAADCGGVRRPHSHRAVSIGSAAHDARPERLVTHDTSPATPTGPTPPSSRDAPSDARAS